MYFSLRAGATIAAFATMTLGSAAFADSISPTSFSDDLAIGESTTVRKTVTITKESPKDALIDVMFVFDVTGSMGGAINQAKTASSAIMTGLAGFGDLRTGTGWYSDPLHDGVHVDLNSGNTAASSGISDMWDTGNCTVAGTHVGCGGDYAEVGYAGIKDAAEDASWRPGSSRFIVALGDASFKTGPDAGDNNPGTMAALAAANVDLIGVSYGTGFKNSVEGLGGEVFAGGSSINDIVNAILDGVSSSFSEYSEVTVGDLGGGMPEIGVSTVCVSADIGICDGAIAKGTYDRSKDRTFEFDVTFTRLAGGDSAFDTFALVDDKIVAREADRFPGAAVVPVPATLPLLLGALAGFGVIRRRKKAA